MPFWGTTKVENHPHPSLPVKEEAIMTLHPDVLTVRGRDKGKGHFHINGHARLKHNGA